MKKIIDVETASVLEEFLGKKMVFMCANHFYTGTLTAINDVFFVIENPSIIYETGNWQNADWKDCQKMNVKEIYVLKEAIECFFETEK